MCADGGQKRPTHDNYGSQQHPQNYSNYGSYPHQYGAEYYGGEGEGGSGHAPQPWTYNESMQGGYYGAGPWYDYGVYGYGGYQEMPYGGYGGGPQASGSQYWGYQQQYNGNYSYDGGQANEGVSGDYGRSAGNAPSHYNRPGSYSNYRRGQSPKWHRQQARGYASDARHQPAMPSSDPTTTSQSPPRASMSPRRTPPPPPPAQRTEPTEEYLSITQNPSSHVEDPSSARKLVVLDLNGSLLLRSAHQRRPPQHRYGYRRDNKYYDDPYADPTKLRPLRTVHRRPYLGAFTSYILHEKTKEWLDTMVWSSAQPHSVEDMVEHCFGDRKSELRAIWARDTLGLTKDDYHKKSLTLKDLAKPWAELPYYTTSPASAAEVEAESETATETKARPETSTDDATAQHHSALSTVLVDDSPLKAKLQPWNHLIIREYLQQTRNVDLKVVEWEEAKERMEKTQREIEALEAARQQPSAVQTPVEPVASAGTGAGASVNEMEEATNEPPSLDPVDAPATAAEDVFVPNARRKRKKLAQQERIRQAREEKQREAFAALQEHEHARLAEQLALAQENGQVAADVQLPQHLPAPLPVVVELKYDETLLAVVGVLDHLKHETNISGWMRSGGLIKTALPASEAPGVETSTMESASSSLLSPSGKHDAPSRGSSPSEHPGSPKKRRFEAPPALDTEVQSVPGENSSPLATEPPLSQAAPSSPSPSQEQEQAETGVPLSAPVPSVSAKIDNVASAEQQGTVPSTDGVAGLWYENEAVLKYWAEQGRKALTDLGIEVDSGMRTPVRQS